MYGRVRVNKHT